MREKLIVLLAFIAISTHSHAQLLWDFRGGVSYQGLKSDYEDSEKGFNYFGELGIDIPIARKFAIETGIHYKNIKFMDDYYNMSDDDDYYDASRANILEIPVKFGYKLPIWENTKVRFSGGPYVAMGCENFGKVYQAGLALSATYEYKYFNFGINYNLPCYKGFKNAYPNGVYATVGIKFKSKAWKYIGATLATICTVGAAAASAFGNIDDGDYSSSTSGYSSYSGSSSDSKSSSNSTVGTDKCKYCGGSGTCRPSTYTSRKKACNGSGLCGYCDGTGWIGSGHAGCTQCNGTQNHREYGRIGDGKCGTCHGTGKCPHCNGTGK